MCEFISYPALPYRVSHWDNNHSRSYDCFTLYGQFHNGGQHTNANPNPNQRSPYLYCRDIYNLIKALPPLHKDEQNKLCPDNCLITFPVFTLFAMEGNAVSGSSLQASVSFLFSRLLRLLINTLIVPTSSPVFEDSSLNSAKNFSDVVTKPC